MLQIGLMLALGGKSYYSAGVLALAIAAGSIPLAGWLDRGRPVLRRAAFAGAAAISGALAVVLLVPLVPVTALSTTRSPPSMASPWPRWDGPSLLPRWRPWPTTCRPYRAPERSS